MTVLALRVSINSTSGEVLSGGGTAFAGYTPFVSINSTSGEVLRQKQTLQGKTLSKFPLIQLPEKF